MVTRLNEGGKGRYSTSAPTPDAAGTWLPWSETREYWSSEDRDGARVKTVVKTTKTVGLQFADELKDVEDAFVLTASADGEVTDNRPDPVIEAAQYREEFLPAGFKLAHLPDLPNNPGMAPTEELDRFREMGNLDTRPEQAYACVFEGDKPELRLGYTVFRARNARDADKLGAAIRKAEMPVDEDEFSRVYQLHAHVLWVGGASGTARQGEELAAKLEEALGIAGH